MSERRAAERGENLPAQEWCRECRDERDEMPYEQRGAFKIKRAEFILWGKLLPPEALGPRCYDHAAKHIGHTGLYRNSGWALYDLRPVNALYAERASRCLVCGREPSGESQARVEAWERADMATDMHATPTFNDGWDAGVEYARGETVAEIVEWLRGLLMCRGDERFAPPTPQDLADAIEARFSPAPPEEEEA